MIINITTVEQAFTKDGAEYRKVKGISDGREVTKSVFDNHKDKWELLKENATLDFKMVKKGQFWNVEDISIPNLPPPTKPMESTTLIGETEPPKVPPAETPPPVGMPTKEKAFALSYAKDLAVANQIKPDKIINWACIFEDYLNGNLHIDDTQLSKLLTGFLTKAKED